MALGRMKLLYCIVVLASVFIALILVAGSRDAQMIAGLLVVVTTALAVPAARRWVRRVRRISEQNGATQALQKLWKITTEENDLVAQDPQEVA